MGATLSAPFKAAQMTNANISREFSYGPQQQAATRRNRRNNSNQMGGRRKASTRRRRAH